MDGFKFKLRGRVLEAPEELYRVSGAKLDAVRLTVQVNLPAFEGGKPTRMNVEVEAWGRARAAAAPLRVGQEVCIFGNVVRRRLLTDRGDYATRKDGSAIWLTDFRAQEVLLPAAAPAELQRSVSAPAELRRDRCKPATPAPPVEPESAAEAEEREDIPF